MPLPYHHETWIVTKLAPYFIDACYADEANCHYYDYIEYTLINQNDVLASKTKTEEELI
jgi:hypothetical protein